MDSVGCGRIKKGIAFISFVSNRIQKGGFCVNFHAEDLFVGIDGLGLFVFPFPKNTGTDRVEQKNLSGRFQFPFIAVARSKVVVRHLFRLGIRNPTASDAVGSVFPKEESRSSARNAEKFDGKDGFSGDNVKIALRKIPSSEEASAAAQLPSVFLADFFQFQPKHQPFEEKTPVAVEEKAKNRRTKKQCQIQNCIRSYCNCKVFDRHSGHFLCFLLR
jgi:hypothetical protein